MTRIARLLLNCATAGIVLVSPLAGPVLAQEQVVNGLNAARVEFNQGSVIESAAPGVWQEYDPQGRPNFRFEERGRDDWSIYLYDPSRNMQVQIDLHTRQLLMVLPNGERPAFGTITGASGTPKMAAHQPAPSPRQSLQNQSAHTVPAAPSAAPAAPKTVAQDDEFNPFADPAQSGPASASPAQTTAGSAPNPRSPRDVIAAAAGQPAFTRGAPAAGSAASGSASSIFDGPWVANTKVADSRGDGIASAVTWNMREAIWITSTDSAITIHFDANPVGSLTLAKVSDTQYSGGGYSARFKVIDRKNMRLTLTGGGSSREYAISKGPSGVKLSRTRSRPETDEEIDTFTAGNLIPRYNDMLFSFRSEKMDLFSANRGRALQIFKGPESTDFSIEPDFQAKTIPLGLRAVEIRRSEGNQLEAVITNTASFEKSMSMNFGISGSFKGVSGGWEFSREESKGADRSDGSTKAFGLARAEVYALLLDKPNMLLSADFRYDILQLAEGEISAQAFVGKYGTHYANAIHYGGIGKAQRTVTTAEFKQWTKESTGYKQEGGFDAGPAGSIKAKGGLTMASGDSRGGSSMFSTENWSASGGSGSMTSLGWNVDERNAVPVRYDLRPLSDLISPIFFGEEWSTSARGGLLQARSSLDAEITRTLQSQPKASDRLLGPIIYRLKFHSLVCVNNGDDGKDDAELYGQIKAKVHGLEGFQDVMLLDASVDNMATLSCSGGKEYPIGREVLVAGNRTPNGAGQGSFQIQATAVHENDPTALVIDDPITVWPPSPAFDAYIFLKDWNAKQPRTDIAGTAITNPKGKTEGPDIRVKVSFEAIQ